MAKEEMTSTLDRVRLLLVLDVVGLVDLGSESGTMMDVCLVLGKHLLSVLVCASNGRFSVEEIDLLE